MGKQECAELPHLIGSLLPPSPLRVHTARRSRSMNTSACKLHLIDKRVDSHLRYLIDDPRETVTNQPLASPSHSKITTRVDANINAHAHSTYYGKLIEFGPPHLDSRAPVAKTNIVSSTVLYGISRTPSSSPVDLHPPAFLRMQIFINISCPRPG